MKIRLSLIAFLCLSACSSNHAPTDNIDPAEIKLAEAASSVSQSLAQMQEINRANTPPSKRLVGRDAYNMPGQISLDWSGPIESLVQRLASMNNYRLRILGNKPASPVIITINANDTPVTDVLRDIDFQAGDAASIFVYPATRILELRYGAAHNTARVVPVMKKAQTKKTWLPVAG